MTKYEKGYGIQVISKRMAKKAAFGEAMQAVKDIVILQEQMQEALASGGKVYGLYHKKDLAGYYIFSKKTLKKAQIEYPFEESVFSVAYTKKEEIEVYGLVEAYMLPECESMKEGFEQDVKAELKESMLLMDVKAVLWHDEALVLQEKKAEGAGKIGNMVTPIALAVLLGITFGQIFDNIALGICFAVMWGVTFGVTFTSATVKELKPVEEVTEDSELPDADENAEVVSEEKTAEDKSEE